MRDGILELGSQLVQLTAQHWWLVLVVGVGIILLYAFMQARLGRDPFLCDECQEARPEMWVDSKSLCRDCYLLAGDKAARDIRQKMGKPEPAVQSTAKPKR